MAELKNTQSVMNRLNRIKPATNFAFNTFFLILAIVCFSPILIIFLISITDVGVIAKEGYKILPGLDEINWDAYKYLWSQRKTIGQALFMSVSTTCAATVLGVILNCSMGYVLSRKEFFLRDPLIYFIFVPMVFGGGMEASYVINTQFLHIWKGVGYGMIVYLATIAGLDTSMYEAAVIDGASKWQQAIYITLPGLKTMLVLMFITAVGGIFNSDFGLFYQATRGANYPLYPVVANFDIKIYQMLTGGTVPLGKSSATSFFKSVISCVMVLSANAIVRKVEPESAMI